MVKIIFFCCKTFPKLQLFQESKREDRKKLADEDAMRKIKQLEDQGYQLQKQLATHKQVFKIKEISLQILSWQS